MDMLQSYDELPITKNSSDTFSGLAYDGYSFYLSMPSCNVICEYDRNFGLLKRYKTCRRYTSICYDTKEKCFWAASQDCYSMLFKLSCNMQELDCIQIRPCAQCGCIINSVSYDCLEDKLLIGFTNCMMLCDKPKCKDVNIFYKNNAVCYTQVFSIAPFYGATYLKGAEQYIHILDSEHKNIFIAQIPSAWVVKGITFYSESLDAKDKAYLYILVLKNSFFPCIICIPIVDSQIKDHLCTCNYITESLAIACIKNNDPCSLVMESVALVESAIANVLNLEGEKMQKMLGSTNDIEKIMETSNYINNTIKNVTHLEHVLYNRLSELCDKYSIEDLLPSIEEQI